jgi:hypothetical protein
MRTNLESTIWLIFVLALAGCFTQETVSTETANVDGQLTGATVDETAMTGLISNQVSFLLNTNDGCEKEKPCFWGIVPGEATVEDLTTRLGEPAYFSHYASYAFQSDQGVKVLATFSIRNGIVENGFVQLASVAEEKVPYLYWKSFSIAAIIENFGLPLNTEVGIDLGRERMDQNFVEYDFHLYFPSSNLRLVYVDGIASVGENIQICPMVTGERSFERVDIYIGENFEDIHSPVTLIEGFTDPSLADFYYSLVANPEAKCLSVDKNLFLQDG